MKWHHIPVVAAIVWTVLCVILGCWISYTGVMGFQQTGDASYDGGAALGVVCCPSLVFVVWVIGVSVLLVWWYLMKGGNAVNVHIH
jgi:hypothetical protein